MPVEIILVVGAFALGFVVSRTLPWFYRKIRRGNLSGTWYQVIPSWEGEPEKLDLVECVHYRDTITGKIRRLKPENQRYKSWEFTTKIRRNLIFGIFLSDDVRKNPGSYGTLQLNMLNENHLQGFYVRLTVSPLSPNEATFTDELRRIPFQWKRNIRNLNVSESEEHE